jgi:hypothetical protein
MLGKGLFCFLGYRLADDVIPHKFLIFFVYPYDKRGFMSKDLSEDTSTSISNYQMVPRAIDITITTINPAIK